jgi:hypothetical protein
MKTRFLATIKAFIMPHILQILTAIAAYFSPVLPVIIAALVFSLTDFITGILAARKKAIKEGKKNWSEWWESSKMQKKIFDLVFYLLAIILAFYFEKLFLEFITFQLSKLVAFVILSVEFWSNMENLSVITGLPLNKQSFFDLANKLRGNNPNN